MPSSPHVPGSPSEKAVEAAGDVSRRYPTLGFGVVPTLKAAHDPALGLDRSVNARWAAEKARELASLMYQAGQKGFIGDAVADDFIKREFGSPDERKR